MFGAFFGKEADAREELARVEVIELRAVDDVATRLCQEAGNRCDNAARRLAGYIQNVVIHFFTDFR